MYLTLLAGLSLVMSFSMRVVAQVITAQCLAGWEWNRNSLGQDPCVIATILDANCRNDSTYTYQKLDPGQYYVPPRKADAGDMGCDCDTVMYSLSAACTNCQQGNPYPWETWIKQCDTVLISDYSGDIPRGTTIPHWAFYNVTLLDKHLFTDANAQSVGRDPEVGPPQPTPSASGKSTLPPNMIGGMVAGMVGGVGSLILIAIYLGYRRWGKNREGGQWVHQEGHDDQRRGSAHSPTSETYGKSFSTGPTLVSNLPFQPYVPPPGPSDPPVTYVTPISGNGGERR